MDKIKCCWCKNVLQDLDTKEFFCKKCPIPTTDKYMHLEESDMYEEGSCRLYNPSNLSLYKDPMV